MQSEHTYEKQTIRLLLTTNIGKAILSSLSYFLWQQDSEHEQVKEGIVIQDKLYFYNDNKQVSKEKEYQLLNLLLRTATVKSYGKKSSQEIVTTLLNQLESGE